ncbi:MAG: T9SS type A sorting domain-containing protein, partial [Bacteroidota bacterium]
VPDLTQDNVDMQYDYRQVYASLLRDWMLVDENKINNDIFFKNFLSGPKEEGTGNYENIVLAEQVISGVQENFVAERFGLLDCFPNPAKESTTVRFRINNTSHVTINLLDNSGKQLKTVISEEKTEGEHSVKIELSDVPPGFYLYQLKTGFVNESKKLIVTK